MFAPPPLLLLATRLIFSTVRAHKCTHLNYYHHHIHMERVYRPLSTIEVHSQMTSDVSRRLMALSCPNSLLGLSLLRPFHLIALPCFHQSRCRPSSCRLRWCISLYQLCCRITLSLSMMLLCSLFSKRMQVPLLVPTLLNMLSQTVPLEGILCDPSDFRRVICAVAPAIIQSGVDVNLRTPYLSTFLCLIVHTVCAASKTVRKSKRSCRLPQFCSRCKCCCIPALYRHILVCKTL